MKEFLSIREVAEYLEVDYKTIYRLVQGGEIPAGKVGGVYRIRRQEVEDYFERQQQALTREAAKAQATADAAELKCGRCLRLLVPHEVAGACEAPDCETPICRTCWDEEPGSRCRVHVLSRGTRLRQAQDQVAQGKVPLLLTSAEAHRREFLYLSRLEAKLRTQAQIHHPTTGRSVRVADWAAVETRVEELDRLRQAMASYLDEMEAGLLPSNSRYSYRLARGFGIEVAVYSDLATHLKQGFVTQPSSHTELFEQLRRAIDRAEAADSLTVLGLAATAGWGEEAVALIQGQGPAARPFYHRLVAPVLVDLANEALAFGRTDERLDQLADLFSPEVAVDVIQEVMDVVETLFRKGRTGILMSEIMERDRRSAGEVTAAFDRLAATGAYRVQDIDKQDRLLLRSA
jgi:excisionase family DNA binding protein